MTNIRPLSNRILVKRFTAKTTKGGIILPDTAQEKPKEGQVVAVGPGKLDEEGNAQELTVKVGDTVLFGAYVGTEVQQGSDEEYLILAEDEVLGVLS